MNLAAYLERINYRGSRVADAETLRALQVAHLESVPFENLSIHAGQPIVLNDAALFEKIVTRRRGGFCYEANGLFAALLRELGFKVEMLAANVMNAAGEYGADFDHLALLVTVDGVRWLADVGFGDSFRFPLRIDERGAQDQGARSYRIEADGEKLILLQRDNVPDKNESAAWQPQYRFTLQTFQYADYEPMCRYHQTSPQSHFTQNKICSLATPDGRITLSGMKFITTRDGVRTEKLLTDQNEYDAVLRGQFGVVIT